MENFIYLKPRPTVASILLFALTLIKTTYQVFSNFKINKFNYYLMSGLLLNQMK